MKRTLLLMAAAGLLLAAVPVVAAPVCTWTGAWESNWGRVDLVQAGDSVTGSYVRQSGKIEGRVSGNVLSGKWSEAPTYKPPKDEGDYEFTMVTACNAFDGRWRYAGEARWRPWTGRRGR